MRIEDTEEYKKWANDLDRLNDRINNLLVWDARAERMQSEYDQLLNEDPRIIKEQDENR